MYRPKATLPKARPAMNAESTAVVASTVLPTTRVSIRTQSISYTRAVNPEVKNTRRTIIGRGF